MNLVSATTKSPDLICLEVIFKNGPPNQQLKNHVQNLVMTLIWHGMTGKSFGLFTWQHSELHWFLFAYNGVYIAKMKKTKTAIYMNILYVIIYQNKMILFFYSYLIPQGVSHPKISNLWPPQSFRHRLPRQSFRVRTHGHTITTWLLVVGCHGLYKDGSGLCIINQMYIYKYRGSKVHEVLTLVNSVNLETFFLDMSNSLLVGDPFSNFNNII